MHQQDFTIGEKLARTARLDETKGFLLSVAFTCAAGAVNGIAAATSASYMTPDQAASIGVLAGGILPFMGVTGVALMNAETGNGHMAGALASAAVGGALVFTHFA